MNVFLHKLVLKYLFAWFVKPKWHGGIDQQNNMSNSLHVENYDVTLSL